MNSAGIYESGPLEEVTTGHFHRQFNLNVLGLIPATREAARLFGPKGGNVANISSVVATFAPPNTAVYSERRPRWTR